MVEVHVETDIFLEALHDPSGSISCLPFMPVDCLGNHILDLVYF